jgi:uncharacterized membrane protein YfcA
MEPFELFIVFIVGLIASFIGTIAGGGGLITIPALIFLGLPAQAAIATSRVGSIGQILSGVYRYHHNDSIDYSIALPATVLSLIGAFIGANTLLLIPEDTLERLIGLLILAVLAFVVINRNVGVEKSAEPGARSRLFGHASFLFLGFWGGFFGGGTGIFASYVLILFFGQTFIEAAGTRKIPGIAMIGISLAVFLYAGLVDWAIGAVLLVSMLIGSYIGASYAIKKGNRWARMLFIIIVLVSGVKLLL